MVPEMVQANVHVTVVMKESCVMNVLICTMKIRMKTLNSSAQVIKHRASKVSSTYEFTLVDFQFARPACLIISYCTTSLSLVTGEHIIYDLRFKAPASFSEQAHLKGVPYFEQIIQPI